MDKNLKKELKKKVMAAIDQVLHEMHIEKPSKRTRRLLKKVSRSLSTEAKKRLKKEKRKAGKSKKSAPEVQDKKVPA